jgi:hypothetical protein
MTDTNPKNANAHRKQRETSIHRVIDRHRPGWNDAQCMTEIRAIIGRTKPIKQD